MPAPCATHRLSIPINHPALRGHFPGFPVVPGVLLLDEVLQRIEADAGAGTHAGVPILWHVSSVKFHRLVLPQQPLSLHYAADAGGSIRFELRLADTLVASGSLQRGASTTANQAAP